MTNVITNVYKNLATGGDVSLSADSFYCCLLDNTIADIETSAIRAFEDYSDISTYEVSGTGYTTSGEALTNTSLYRDDTNNKSIWKADNLSWNNSSFTVRGLAFYKDGGFPVIGVTVFDEDMLVSNADYNLNLTNGIMNIK